MKKLIIGLVALAAVMAVILLIAPDSYDKANEKTNKLNSYKMEISTFVTIEDGDAVKQSSIGQVVRVQDKGKSSMRYEVVTTATSSDMTNGKVVTETNSYMYNNMYYYYAYPGVKYKSPTEFSMANENIKNLTNVISFTSEQMKNLEKEKTDEGDVYLYGVDFADVSPYVKSALQNAVSLFAEGNFSLESVDAAATVKDGYVQSRELCVVYSSGEDKVVTLEIYTTLLNADEKVEAPDESKYANIMG